VLKTKARCPTASASLDSDGTLHCTGAWQIANIPVLEHQLAEVLGAEPVLQIWQMSGVSAMDTAGAWLVRRSLNRLEQTGRHVELRGLRAEFEQLIRWISVDEGASVAGQPEKPGMIEQLGQVTWDASLQGLGFLSFVGESTLVLLRLLVDPRRMRWQPLFYNLKAAGFQALPIVGLLSFLMGVVIAYQAAVALRPYGASVFIVEFVGISMLREIVPLITAIIVAGRSGSAYTAQIGTMTVTEEVSALRTMGIGPIELLIAPKVFALVVALPLLTAFADVAGVFGGMVIASTQLDVNFNVFLERFESVITPTDYLIGVGKAPVFAVIIAMIGCYQGLCVSGSAESVGRHTTVSVVQSIFLVIVVDALCSILLDWMGIGLFAR